MPGNFPALFVRFVRVTLEQFWVGELKKYEPSCRIALVGCKSDLAAGNSQTKPNGGSEDSAAHGSVTMK